MMDVESKDKSALAGLRPCASVSAGNLRVSLSGGIQERFIARLTVQTNPHLLVLCPHQESSTVFWSA